MKEHKIRKVTIVIVTCAMMAAASAMAQVRRPQPWPTPKLTYSQVTRQKRKGNKEKVVITECETTVRAIAKRDLIRSQDHSRQFDYGLTPCKP